MSNTGGPVPGPGNMGPNHPTFGSPPPHRTTGPSWLIPIVVLAAVLLVIGIFVSVATNLSGSTAPAPTVTVTETVTEESDPEPAATVTVTAKPPPAAKPKATLPEGVSEIGEDAPPGRYKTTVPDDSYGCYWERAKDDKGSLNSIIANDNLEPGARGSVTVKRGEFFKSSGCGTWRKQ